MQTSRFEANVRPGGAGTVVELVGDVDAGAESALDTAWVGAAERGGVVTLDFARVGYVNSTGIALLVGLLARARRDRVDVEARGPPITTARSSRSHASPTSSGSCRTARRRADAKEEGMPEATLTLDVRDAGGGTVVVDVRGDVTAASEDLLMDAYVHATEGGARAIVLNFDRLEYMNSGGIGLLVTLLVRANRAKQRLLACGLNEHYRQILELTRLDDAIGIHGSEAEAIAAAAG
jgi:anti-sigma B factor antagonist